MSRTLRGKNAFFNLPYNLTTQGSSFLDQSQYLLRRKNWWIDNNVINEGMIHMGFNGKTENHTNILNH